MFSRIEFQVVKIDLEIHIPTVHNEKAMNEAHFFQNEYSKGNELKVKNKNENKKMKRKNNNDRK